VAQPGERVADAEVGGQEDVGVAECPQGDVVGRPRPDAGEGEQPAPDVVAVGAAVQGQGSAGKLVNDKELYNNAKLTLQKLDKATEGLEDQGPLSVMGILVNKLF